MSTFVSFCLHFQIIFRYKFIEMLSVIIILKIDYNINNFLLHIVIIYNTLIAIVQMLMNFKDTNFYINQFWCFFFCAYVIRSQMWRNRDNTYQYVDFIISPLQRWGGYTVILLAVCQSVCRPTVRNKYLCPIVPFFSATIHNRCLKF